MTLVSVTSVTEETIVCVDQGLCKRISFVSFAQCFKMAIVLVIYGHCYEVLLRHKAYILS